MKKTSPPQTAAMKKLFSKIARVNSELDEICTLLKKLESPKKAVKKPKRKAR